MAPSDFGNIGLFLEALRHDWGLLFRRPVPCLASSMASAIAHLQRQFMPGCIASHSRDAQVGAHTGYEIATGGLSGDAAGCNLPKAMMPGRKRNPVDEVRNEWQRFNPQGLAALEFYRSTYHYTPRRSGQGRPRTEDQGDLSCSAFAAAIASFACYCVVNGGARPEQDRRVYRECALQLRYKALKRRVKAKLRDDRKPATRSNDTGAMDFVHDRLAKGTSFACLRSSISSRDSHRR